MQKLSVVATPIGNLEDITLRALRVLKEADVIACEDTRVTKKLLSHFDIHTPTVTFNANSGEKGFAKIIELLEGGKHIALVSDAGTPGLSDPGLELVSVVRESASRRMPELKIEAIVGPSALAAAVSIAGLRAPSFTFYGFLPLKKGRETIFKEIAASERASVMYESPHRIMKTLEALAGLLPEARRVGVFREITKVYEEAVVGSGKEVLKHFVDTPEKQRGEFVVIVEGL
ncbi:MAG: 16S rRNA (cytidine1402-2'-O)-methyltransferase [Parcubacteria group bacterium Gr01-1014_56]|nr:MAG: 16S rRNA (cytidine1402-2'-O)-methyltransferase [Parcubacteria group bacterium Gr01-1014_56]